MSCQQAAGPAGSGATRSGPAPFRPGRAARMAAFGAALLLAGIGQAAGQAGQPCADINNTTDYYWPIRLQIGDGPYQQMRIEKRTFGRLCMRNAAATDQPLTVSVRSSWMPVGECVMPPGGLVTIERRPGPDGNEVTHVTCAPPRN